MAKGKDRRGREEKKPKQKKTELAPAPSFSKGLTVDSKPPGKKS